MGAFFIQTSFAEPLNEHLVGVENEKEKEEDDKYDNEDGDEQGEGEEDFVETQVPPLKPATGALDPGMLASYDSFEFSRSKDYYHLSIPNYSESFKTSSFSVLISDLARHDSVVAHHPQPR